MSVNEQKRLSKLENEIYSWQSDVEGFGPDGQEKLKNATVLISRCGGLGGVVAYELAAAGIGKMILAHAGNIKPSDLNRQLLMTREGIGQSRMDSIQCRLKELNPDLEIQACPENISVENADALVQHADVVVDAAPLFEERYAMNDAVVKYGKPMIECAVFSLESHLTTMLPGMTPCLRCLYPEKSTTWKRRFPVFGAVSGSLGSLAAMEVIKLIGGFGEPLFNVLLSYDLNDVSFRRYNIRKDPNCPVCSHL
ncbi:MAG: HesA/MoeB/ThiF family protein [Verrucomicrobia bacterium]|jgi:molybdopterin-synthase adenylyltransferase|nr:HesA/MoeB/ThiF family protein [Verrucomicrobiota bacterium]